MGTHPRRREILLEAVHDPAHGQIIGAEFDSDSITWKNTNVVHSHFSADVRQDLHLAFIQLHTKTGIRQILKDYALDFDALLFVLLWFIRWSFSRHCLQFTVSMHETPVNRFSRF